jgi:hypothetical protein
MAGVMTLYIDDVLIPLTFAGGGFTPFGSFAANNVYFFSLKAPSAVSSSKIQDVFVTSGIQPPTTVYCCS